MNETDYKFTVSMKYSGIELWKKSKTVRVNTPPKIGTIKVTPKEGMALENEVEIKAEGWVVIARPALY